MVVSAEFMPVTTNIIAKKTATIITMPETRKNVLMCLAERSNALELPLDVFFAATAKQNINAAEGTSRIDVQRIIMPVIAKVNGTISMSSSLSNKPDSCSEKPPNT